MRNLVLSICFFLFLSIELFSQVIIQGSSSNIWFNNPTNGLDITGAGYGATQTTVPMNLQYNYSVSGSFGYFIKLFPTPYATQQSNIDDGIDQWWYLPPAVYTWRLELWEYDGLGGSHKTAEETITFNVKHMLTIKNNFNAGNLYIDGNIKPSGSQVYKFTNNSLSLGAIDQAYGSYYYIWNQNGTNNSVWQKMRLGETSFAPISGAISRNYNYTVASNDNGAQLQGALRKVCNVTIRNSFVNAGNGGIIKVNGTQYNSPATGFTVNEASPITSEAINGTYGQIFNYIHYYFDHWGDGSTSYSRTFYPTLNTTYTAYFKGYPHPDDINFDWDFNVGHPIKFHWTDNPNTNVTQYQIWRIVKQNGIMGDPHLLTTVGRGVQTYTDYGYSFTSGYTNDLLWYDVRQYYSTEQTLSDVCWHPVYGALLPKSNENDLAEAGNITEYDLGCYPNPFNPSTVIRYQLPEAGEVLIKIYDILGREIKTLLNGFKDVGKYEISFDASDLPSGVYLYMLKSGDYVSVKKMLLNK